MRSLNGVAITNELVFLILNLVLMSGFIRSFLGPAKGRLRDNLHRAESAATPKSINSADDLYDLRAEKRSLLAKIRSTVSSIETYDDK